MNNELKMIRNNHIWKRTKWNLQKTKLNKILKAQ